MSTGPLGQGAANAVGLAIAQKHLGAVFNKPGFEVIGGKIWTFLGDGCMQEGIASEAASLAGHLQLDNLIYVYDDNKITIDGATDLSFTEDVEARFKAYKWNTIRVSNADTGYDEINNAFEQAKKSNKPTLILCRTTIGFGSDRAGSQKAHGEPLGSKLTIKLKEHFGFDPKQSFFVPEDVRKTYAAVKEKGAIMEQQWNAMMKQYEKTYPDLAAEFWRRFRSELPNTWNTKLPVYTPKDKQKATRALSQEVLNGLGQNLPELIGGSADLAPSNLTEIKGRTDFQKGKYGGQYIRFGVREHAMVAIGNGIAAFGGLIPYTATFLVFLPYAFPAIRMAAISHHRHILVMTHDSIGLGEDGPTHQPIETLAICRATPNVLVIRPCDGNEVIGAYNAALKHQGPTVIALSRQGLPNLEASTPANVEKGAYIAFEKKVNDRSLDLVLIGTGSEVSLAIETAKLFDLNVRVVSMPTQELFEKQPVAYRRTVLPPGVLTVSIEALTIFGWNKFAHHTIGMKSFGASAPGNILLKKFGFEAVQVKANIEQYRTVHDAQTKQLKLPNAYGPLPIHFELGSKL